MRAGRIFMFDLQELGLLEQVGINSSLSSAYTYKRVFVTGE